MPAFKIGNSNRSDLTKSYSVSPGPGAYHNSGFTKIKPKALNYTFSRDERLKAKTEENQKANLGPGTYNNKGSIGDGPKARIVKQAPKSELSVKTPGPGAYEQSSVNSNRSKLPKYSFGMRHNSNSSNSNPGPGTYRTTKNFMHEQGYVVDRSYLEEERKADRFKTTNTTSDQPGPGNYEDRYFVTRKTASNWKIGDAKRYRENSMDQISSPGPGSYDYQSNLSRKYASMKFRNTTGLVNNNKSHVPGPDSYEQKSMLNQTGYSWGLGKQPRFRKSPNEGNGPSPAQYNLTTVNASRSPEVRIGTSERDAIKSKFATPGPGNYEASSSISKTAFSFGSRIGATWVEGNPGPDQYTVHHTYKYFDQPTFTIGRGNRSDLGKTGSNYPGPGNYENKGDFNYDEKPGVKQTTFGKAIKLHNRDFNNVPGPGHYREKEYMGDLPPHEKKSFTDHNEVKK